MPSLYIENVPEDLYKALRERARAHRSSISAEVLSLLKNMLPTADELARRQALLKRALQIRCRPPASARPFLAAEELQREDRLR